MKRVTKRQALPMYVIYRFISDDGHYNTGFRNKRTFSLTSRRIVQLNRSNKYYKHVAIALLKNNTNLNSKECRKQSHSGYQGSFKWAFALLMISDFIGGGIGNNDGQIFVREQSKISNRS